MRTREGGEWPMWVHGITTYYYIKTACLGVFMPEAQRPATYVEHQDRVEISNYQSVETLPQSQNLAPPHFYKLVSSMLKHHRVEGYSFNIVGREILN